MPTFVTLVSTSIVVVASRALSFHVAICQERSMGLTERLLRRLLGQIAILVQLLEDGLRNFGVLFCRGATEVIEANLKPLIHLLVDLVIFGAQLFRCHLLLQSFSLRRRSVFISTTDVQCLMSTCLVESEDPGQHRKAGMDGEHATGVGQREGGG